MEYILCWETAGQGAWPGVWLMYLGSFHWRKLIVPFPGGMDCIASWLGEELSIHFPFSELEFCWVWTCAGVMATVTIPVSSYMYQPYCVSKTLFPWSHVLQLTFKIVMGVTNYFFEMHSTPDTIKVARNQRLNRSWAEGESLLPLFS